MDFCFAAKWIVGLLQNGLLGCCKMDSWVAAKGIVGMLQNGLLGCCKMDCWVKYLPIVHPKMVRGQVLVSAVAD